MKISCKLFYFDIIEIRKETMVKPEEKAEEVIENEPVDTQSDGHFDRTLEGQSRTFPPGHLSFYAGSGREIDWEAFNRAKEDEENG